MNRTIYNRARTLLIETRLPKILWGEAVKCAVYQLNRCPSSAINFKTPAEKRFGNKDLAKLRVFGAKAWMHILPKQDKLSKRSKEMIFVGYGANGYRLWDSKNNDIIVSRDVRFDETKTKYKEEMNKNKIDDTTPEGYFEEEIMEKEDTKKDKEDDQKRSEIYQDQFEMQQPTKEDKTSKEVTKNDQEDTEKTENISEGSNNEENRMETKEYITRSGRNVQKPKRIVEDYELYTAYCLLSGE